VTARPPTWEDLIGHGAALCALSDGGWLCRWCAGVARLFVHREGDPVACVACGESILSVAEIEARRAPLSPSE
jgi:hypothetical protein